MTLQTIQASVELPSVGENEPLPTRFRLLTSPVVELTKGKYIFDAAAAESVMAAYRAWGNDLSGDYEHQSMNPNLTGPVPASFWSDLEVDQDGHLHAVNVKWTPVAAKALRNKEYRYVSPTFNVDANRRVVSIVNVALTNTPSTLNQVPLVAARRGTQMPPETQPAEVVAAAVTSNTASDQILVLASVKTHAEAVPVLAAWKSSHDALPAVQAELAKLQASVAEGEKRTIVASMRAAGKALPTQEAFLLSLSAEQLRAYESTAPVLLNRVDAKKPPTAPAGDVGDVADFQTLVTAKRSDVWKRLQDLEQENPAAYQKVMAARRAHLG